jgi:hypothetical protein
MCWGAVHSGEAFNLIEFAPNARLIVDLASPRVDIVRNSLYLELFSGIGSHD